MANGLFKSSAAGAGALSSVPSQGDSILTASLFKSQQTQVEENRKLIDEYYAQNQNTDQNRGGFWGGIGYAFEKLGLGFLQSIEGIWDFTAGGLADLFGADDWAEKQMANDWVNYNDADEWFNPSDGWKVVGDVTGGIGTSLPSMLTVAAAAGIAVASGGTLTPLAAGMIGGAVAGLGAAGTATKQAYQETGKLTGKEWGYGALSGFTEGAMEGVTDAIGFGVGAIAKNLAASTAKEGAVQVGKTIAQSAARQTFGKTILESFISEAFEEGVQELIDPVWKRITYDPSAENATFQQVAYAALVGGLSGAIMGGADVSVRNSINYFSGSRINSNGGSQGVISLAEKIAETEGVNQSGNEQVDFVVKTLGELQESLQSTDGEVRTPKQKMLVGILSKANTYAPLSIIVHQNADAIINNAEVAQTAVQRLSDMGYKTSDGKTVTIDMLKPSLDGKRDGNVFERRKYRKSLSEALRNNEALRTVSAMSAAGELNMDAARFADTALRGENIRSQADLNQFIERADDAKKRDVGARLGISDWNSITLDELNARINEFFKSGGAEQYINERNEIKKLSELEISKKGLPKYIGAITEDGAVRYKYGDASIAIIKNGDTYRIYDYANDLISKPLSRVEANRVLREINNAAQNTNNNTSSESNAAAEVRNSSEQQVQELDNFAREHVPDYKKLVGAQQQAVRQTLRQARAANLSEADQILYASIAARSGAEIEFVSPDVLRSGDKVGDAVYSMKDGKILVNRENASNPNARTAAKIILHEFTHGIIGAKYTAKGALYISNPKAFKKFFNTALKGLTLNEKINILTPYVERHNVSMQDFLNGKVDFTDDVYMELREELAANFVERELGNAAALRRIISDNPTFKDRLMSFLKKADTDYSSNEKLSRAAKALLKKYQTFFNKYATQTRFSPTIKSDVSTETMQQGETRNTLDMSKKQDKTSAATSINSSKLPAVFSRVQFKRGTVNLDIGGGKFDNATEFLATQGVKNYIYDPYNRSEEHNRAVARATENGQSDTVTISNVLNVIDTLEGRQQVLANAVDALKPDGMAYITVYEGNGSGEARTTGADQFQLNRKLRDYLPEVRQFFADVTVKNGVIIARSPIKTSSEQNGGKRFALSIGGENVAVDVQEEGNLVALHNLSEQSLLKVLRLGGFPMPSIAITKADMGHTEYGNITVVFGRETIDPQSDSRNKVYERDGWTPTAPKVEYKPNEKVWYKIRKKHHDLAQKVGYDAARPLYNFANDIERQLEFYGGEIGLISSLYDNTDVMNLFLVDTGREYIKPIQNEIRSELSESEKTYRQSIIDALGKDFLNEWDKLKNDGKKAFINLHKAKIVDALAPIMKGKESIEETKANISQNFSTYALGTVLNKAVNYLENGGISVRTETDITATREAILKATPKQEYIAWLENLFGGIEEKTGIYNGTDPYTRSGNRRSFEALHYEYTLENMVRAMSEAGEKGQSSWHGLTLGQLQAKLSKEFKSIGEIRLNAEKLTARDEAAHEQFSETARLMLNEITSEMVDKSRYMDDVVYWQALDSAQMVVGEIADNKLFTLEKIAEFMKREYPKSYIYNDSIGNKILGLFAYVQTENNTDYFEAKPRRAVTFSEIKRVLIPETASEKLIKELKSRHIPYQVYDTGENSRTEAIKQMGGIRFALSNTDSQGRKLTAAQREYFKDSKIVDRSGKLLTLYHGSRTSFTEFDEHFNAGWNMFGNGFYFTSDKERAQRYARTELYECYLNVKNPFITDNAEHLDMLYKEIGTTREAVTKFAKKNGYGGSEFFLLCNYLDDTGKNVAQYIRKLGFDGIFDYKQDGKAEVVAYKSNQIKLTTNKNPSSSSDIRFAMRIDEYSESQYNNFGWVRANDVVSSSHWRDFTTKFARAKGGSNEFVKTASGEFIIPVNDMTGKGFGVDNVLIYAKGSIDNPKISKIVKINLDNETDIDIVRSQIYAREQKSWTRASNSYANYYESELVGEFRPANFRDYQSYKAEIGKRGGRSESGRTDGNNQRTQNRSGNTGSDTRYALRNDGENRRLYTKGQRAKFAANNTRLKVYSKMDAQSVIDSIIDERLILGNGRYAGELSGKSRAEAIEQLFIKLNSTPEGYQIGAALDIADYIINNAVLTDMYDSYDSVTDDMFILSTLRGYMHKMNLRGIQGEINYAFDKHNTINLIWGTKERGIAPEEVAQELEDMGIHFNAINDAEIFFEMLDMYEQAKKRVNKKADEIMLTAYGGKAEVEQLRQDIARDILLAFDQKGEQSKYARLVEQYTQRIADLKDELHTAYRRNTLVNRIIDGAAYLRDIATKRNYVGADVFTAPELTQWLKQLSKLKYRSDLRKTGVRQILLDYGKFYNTNNPLLYDEDPNLSYIDQNVIDALNFIRQNALSNKPLSTEELQAAQVIIASAKHLFDTYDQVIMEGKKQRITDLATQGNQIIQKSKNRTNKAIFNRIYGVFNKIIEPRVVIESLENFNPNGILTRAYDEITKGETAAGELYIELTEDIDAYIKQHKHYSKRLASEHITVAGAELTVGQAITLYELSKRTQAQDGLYNSGFTYEDSKGSIKSMRVTQSDIDALSKAFTDTDKGFISLVEEFFNVKSKQVKTDADMQILGYTNASDDFYYPIQRDKGTIAKNITDARSLMADWANVYNFSFNKDVKVGAQNQLYVADVYSVLTRHAKQLSTYAKMTVPLKNFSQIYAKNIGDKTNVISIRNTLNRQVWRGAEAYLSKLFADIQGRATSSSVIERMRGAYAKYQLGANAKVIVSQITSYPTAGILLDAGVLARGFVMRTNWSAMDKYCPYARVRNYERGIVRAEGVIDKIGKVGDVLTKPIQWTDRFTIGRLWNACQLQVQKDSNLKLGTVENMQKAGELLEDVIRLTQPNYTNTERSELMRSDSDIVRAFTMFTSVPLKQLSRLVETFGEYNALRSAIKSGDADPSLQGRYKASKRKIGRVLASVTIANLMYVLVGQLFKFLYNDMAEDDEEGKVTAKSFFLDLLQDFGSTTIGMLPFVRDIYDFFAKDYDIDTFSADMLNGILDPTKQLFDLVTKAVSGEEIKTQDYMRAFRDSLYGIGQLTGLPFRNINNTITGLIRRFSTATAYEYTSLFYNPKYSSDIKAALKKGDYGLAQTIMGMLLKDDRTGGLSKNSTQKLVELYDGGYTVLPKSIGDTITYNGVEIPLTSAQKQSFKAQYSEANEQIERLVNSAGFASLPAEQQAKAIKMLYDAYYSKALSSIVGVISDNQIIMLSAVISPSSLATIMTAVSAIKADVDKTGKAINNTKKAKVIKYIWGQRLNTVQKLLLILSMGYTIKDGDIRGLSATRAKTMVAKYITTLRMTKEQKTALAEKCGLTVKNGRIYTN